MACELYCCLLPQCEALRICCSGFSIATVYKKKSNTQEITNMLYIQYISMEKIGRSLTLPNIDIKNHINTK